MPKAHTRERILAVAMPLFAQRGFKATTIGDIEQAAGLAPRRGGLYRHFSSKEEVFRAAVTQYATKFVPLVDLWEELDFDDERTTLTALAEFTLEGLVDESDLLLLLQRDGQDFPELTAHVHAQLIERGYTFATELFRRLLHARDLPTDDAQALAAIALGSLVHFREDEAIYRRTPANVTQDRFVATWVSTWLHVLTARSLEAAQLTDQT
jgi:AcrR family transcriptional regulator